MLWFVLLLLLFFPRLISAATDWMSAILPGDFVLDGDPAPLPKKGVGALCPIFGPCLLRPSGWMDQDSAWHRGGP